MQQLIFKVLLLTSLITLSAAASADNLRHCEDLRHGSQAGCWRQGTSHHDRFNIYYRQGNHWRQAPGAATDVGNGWVIGTDRRKGGYGIYRWTGYGWRRAPGAAVEIGGPYERPWVINDRNERFVWNGRDWDRVYGRRSNRHYNDSGRGYRDQRRHQDTGSRRRYR